MSLKSIELLSRKHSFHELKPKIFTAKINRAVKVMGKPVKIEGVDEELQNILNANMEQVGPRRRAREAFKDIQLSIDHILFKMPCDGLKMTESYEVNARGLEIFSKSWIPESTSPKAVVCFCHGYGDTCTFFFEGMWLQKVLNFTYSVLTMLELNDFTHSFVGIARMLASSGYGVFAMDYPGFGLSEGLHGYIPKFDQIVNDVIEHYSKVKENEDFCKLPSFLLGESMGGAVALKVHLKQPDSWTGAILVAPMCKIADDMVPPWPMTQVLIGVAKLLPKRKLVPQKDLAELAFKDVKKREQTVYNVISYKHKPRLKTALELLRTTQDIEQQLEKVSLPLLILHGKDDKVTDPSVSKALYEKASSADKKLNLYDDAWHSLLEGEPDDMILRVLGDIVYWLDEHS